MIKVSDFVKNVPQVARKQLPTKLQKFRVFVMPWLSQVYYDDKLLHYEVVKLPQRYGDNRLEIGLHFESKNKVLNDRLLVGFDHHLFEIRAALGDDWWAEPWDRNWTKVYTAFTYTVMDDDLLQETSARFAQMICIMQPIFNLVYSR